MASNSQPQGNLRAKLDLIATALTIVTCITVCAFVAVRVLGSPAIEPGAPIKGLTVGSVLKPSEEFAYETSAMTALIGLSSTCRYCQESMPALQQLNNFVRARPNERIQVFAVGLESRDVLSKYLGENGLTVYRPTTVKVDSDVVLVASRTPTLVLVDRTGKVLVSWTGRMTSDEMDSVIRKHMTPTIQQIPLP